MGLKAGGATYGMGASAIEEPEISLEDILKYSEFVGFKNGTDAIKTFSMDEKSLSEMPMSAQPAALRSTLLPYQLQVCIDIVSLFPGYELNSARGWPG